jgi:hypothetical protein
MYDIDFSGERCYLCDAECHNTTGYCDECIEDNKQEEDLNKKAKSLMDLLGIESYEMRHAMEDDRVVSVRTLYDIFTNKDKSKALIFKLKNKAFL